MQGFIFDIRHCTIHDGQGIRTTVFLKGCPLKCWWCHNPEGLSEKPVMINKKRQIGAKKFYEKTVIGQYISEYNLLEEIKKDNVFYEESGGGVTFSGGEPLLQGRFLINIVKKCHDLGIHTIIDTSGYGDQEIISEVSAFVDLFLFDIKTLDDDIHRKYIGVSNISIIKNLDLVLSLGKKTIVRYPLIPGINNSKRQLDELGFFLSGKVNEVHFLPYHSIGNYKYEEIGIKDKMPETKEPDEAYLENLKNEFIEKGFIVKIGG